jgi:hypothetical protein
MAEQRGTTLGRQVAEVRGDLDWIVLKALEKERDASLWLGHLRWQRICSGIWQMNRC